MNPEPHFYLLCNLQSDDEDHSSKISKYLVNNLVKDGHTPDKDDLKVQKIPTDVVDALVSTTPIVNSDLSFISAFSDLRRAFDSSTSNSESAKILRLFTTDFEEFNIQYGTAYNSFTERYNRGKING